MKRAEIDIEKPPPSMEVLMARRDRIAADLQQISRWQTAIIVMGISLGLALLAANRFDVLPVVRVEWWWALIYVGMFAGLVGYALHGARTMLLTAAMTVLAMTVFIVGWGLVAGAAPPSALGLVVACTVGIMGFLVARKVHGTSATLEARLQGFSPLGPETFPEKTVDFVGICKTNEDVQAYQQGVADSGRDILLCEYKAAREWVEGAKTREQKERLIEEAKTAWAYLKGRAE